MKCTSVINRRWFAMVALSLLLCGAGAFAALQVMVLRPMRAKPA